MNNNDFHVVPPHLTHWWNSCPEAEWRLMPARWQFSRDCLLRLKATCAHMLNPLKFTPAHSCCLVYAGNKKDLTLLRERRITMINLSVIIVSIKPGWKLIKASIFGEYRSVPYGIKLFNKFLLLTPLWIMMLIIFLQYTYFYG